MTVESPLPNLARQVVDLVDALLSEIRPRLLEAALSRDRGENENLRHQGNFLSDHDLWAHQRYQEGLAEFLPSFIYASEEDEPQVIGDDPDPDLCVLVDPLDTSELAVRALHGYTHVLVYSRSRRRPVVAVVGDVFHHVRLYVAALHDDGTDRACLITTDGDQYPLSRPSDADLTRALVTNYFMRPAERFAPLAGQHRFFEALGAPGSDGKARGRIGVDFGSISLCHVAAGFTDATVEFAKGFAAWDLSPGHYVLHAAGGTTIDLDGAPIALDYGLNDLAEINRTMGERRKFIAAGNPGLAQELLAVIDR
ncbi:hypothetical protein GCM10027063_36840 [Promicromonospora xylanilytica]